MGTVPANCAEEARPGLLVVAKGAGKLLHLDGRRLERRELMRELG